MKKGKGMKFRLKLKQTSVKKVSKNIVKKKKKHTNKTKKTQKGK